MHLRPKDVGYTHRLLCAVLNLELTISACPPYQTSILHHSTGMSPSRYLQARRNHANVCLSEIRRFWVSTYDRISLQLPRGHVQQLTNCSCEAPTATPIGASNSSDKGHSTMQRENQQSDTQIKIRIPASTTII